MLKIKTVPTGMLEANCYIVVDGATGLCAVIDPGELTPALDCELSDVGYDKIKYIILTHGHYDHIGGTNDVLKKTDFKAEVAIGVYDVPLLSNPGSNLSAYFTDKIIDNIKCDFPLHDGDIISLGESSLKVLHTPGHTVGSVCLVGDGVIFSGDTLFLGSMGRTDFPTGSVSDMRKSLKKLADLTGDYTVYPGHNSATTLEYERKNNPYI